MARKSKKLVNNIVDLFKKANSSERQKWQTEAQKNYEFFVSQGIPKDEALNLSMKLSRNFDAAFLELEKDGIVTAKKFHSLARARNIDPLPNVDIETLEVGDVYYIPGQKSLVSIVLKEGKKDLLQTKY